MTSSLTPIKVLILAIPETAGSALYGLIDVLSAAGNLWQTLTREQAEGTAFDICIVSADAQPFHCGNRIPVIPDYTLIDAGDAEIIILPELWLAPDESLRGRYADIMRWIREHYQRGSHIYSACSGALLLAESGLLNGCPATSHWGYRELFQRDYPGVRFMPEPNLVIADTSGRIVTAGGTTSWHDLALHIIARHINPGEALRIAKVYLLKWHTEGQLPFTPLVIQTPHNDAIVRRCQQWLAEHYQDNNAVSSVVSYSGIAERTLKRRFKMATGTTLMDYVQNLRIEAAKKLLETSTTSIDEISIIAGYEDASFFRRLFRRLTGVSPRQYRQLFSPASSAVIVPER